MKDQINPTNFHQVCRLCLENFSETSSLFPIFVNENVSRGEYIGQYFKEFNESVPQIIASCVGIEIDPADGLPTAICSKCEKSLIVSNTFRHKCLQTNNSLQQFKVKSTYDNTNDIEDDTSHYPASDPEFLVNRIKEETQEEITDQESESDSVWSSCLPQNNYSSTLRRSAITTNSSNIPLRKPENERACGSKMCIICGMIVKRLREHIVTRPHLSSNGITHIDVQSTRDSHTSSPILEKGTGDFLMCRMFYKSLRQYVKVQFLSSEIICLNDFIRAASEKFTFDIDSFDHFVDIEGFTIENNDFLNIISNNASQNGFAVGIILRKDGEVNNSTPLNINTQEVATKSHVYTNNAVTADDLKDYLIKRKAAHILQEYKDNFMLSDKSRRHLINAAVNYLEENFGIYPKRIHKEAVAHAIIELFPIYKTQNSSTGGIDLFLNGQTGYLNSRLKNLQSKRRLEEGSNLTSDGSSVKKPKSIHVPDDDEHGESITDNNANIEDDLHFLRNAVAPSQNEAIKYKLKSTLRTRGELTSNKPSVNVRTNFPFFFKDPSLISFDYNLRFSAFDENLHRVVTSIQTNIFQIFQSLKFEENVDDYSDWPHIIQCFLCLLKLLPPTATGRYSKSRQTFQQRVNSFILFTKDHVSASTIFSNINPFIVAIGSNRSAIEKYFVVVDGCLIHIPREWNFVNVFDLFFKVHFVFNLDYNDNLRTFLRFFEKFAYNHTSTKITNRIQEISTRLFYHQLN